jgi:CRISPR-associated exonuclease Cas4
VLDNSDVLFTVTDLKQYIYCPRIFYYHACLPDVRPVTAKMQHGLWSHQQEQKRAARRTLHQYHVVEGQRYFDMVVMSEKLGLTGQVDEVVESADGVFPVDYKLAKRASYHFKLQLTAYALLLEEISQQKIERGYLYLMRSSEWVTVRFTRKLRTHVKTALAEMHQLTAEELMPPPTSYRQRCPDCEFRRFCNDV